MAITLRTASHDSATTATRPLTHAELDANFTSFLDSGGSSLVGFLQSGTGLSATTTAAQLQKSEYFATKSALKGWSGSITNGTTAFVGGGVTANDGLGGTYRWDSSSTDTDNNFSVIAPTAGGTGRWLLQTDKVTVADLTEPFYIAHRGASCISPENTLEAYRSILATGHKALEAADVYKLRDGALGVMHDSTLTRTTSSSGNTADQTGVNWEKIVVDASSWFPTHADTRPPFYQEILSLVAGQAIIFPEAKNAGSGQLLYNAVKQAGMLASCIPNSFLIDELEPFLDAGVPVMYNPTTTAETPATIVGYGATYVGLGHGGTATAAYIASLVAAGLKVVVSLGAGNGYGRRVLRDAYLAEGVIGFFCDDPLWTAGTAPVLTTDPFATLAWYPGMIPGSAPDGITGTASAPSPGTTTRGSFVGTDRFGWEISGGLWTMQGWGSPVASAAGTWRMVLTITYDQLASPSDTTRWASVAFACPTDKDFRANVVGDGYVVILRESGQMALYRSTSGTLTQLEGNVATAAISAGGTAVMQIDVTPTSVQVQRTDVAGSITSTDTTYRGGYFHFGKDDSSKDAHYSFSDVTITNS